MTITGRTVIGRTLTGKLVKNHVRAAVRRAARRVVSIEVESSASRTGGGIYLVETLIGCYIRSERETYIL